MRFSDKQIAGTVILLGSLQFILCMVVSESLYINYSVSKNFISDLGVGKVAWLFNSSIILFGLSVLASAYFFNKAFNYIPGTLLLFITGLGIAGVGIFPENIEPWHFIASFVAFFFGGILAIGAYRFEKPPLNCVSVILGLLSLGALVLFAIGSDLGLGQGGMERIIAYPILLWAIAFGTYLSNS